MQAVAEEYPVVGELLDVEAKYRSDPLLQRQYDFEERAHKDYLLNLKAEGDDGEKRGLAKGRKEERENIIRTLLADGVYTDEQIAQLFGTPIELIKEDSAMTRTHFKED